MAPDGGAHRPAVDIAEVFERDLRDRLLAVRPDGDFEDAIHFAYDLAVKR